MNRNVYPNGLNQLQKQPKKINDCHRRPCFAWNRLLTDDISVLLRLLVSQLAQGPYPSEKIITYQPHIGSLTEHFHGCLPFAGAKASLTQTRKISGVENFRLTWIDLLGFFFFSLFSLNEFFFSNCCRRRCCCFYFNSIEHCTKHTHTDTHIPESVQQFSRFIYTHVKLFVFVMSLHIFREY